eukprot:TRINITY_DN2312_c0_g1_i3.p1 TRINITY_DN2312_c0_g1~~TRINITY_DN2312_c0_g1_i3.p1  ORF type:complete len:913 (-),score=66.44 TRINITY_DN2312_c0_g1_i3:112-2493(-)
MYGKDLTVLEIINKQSCWSYQKLYVNSQLVRYLRDSEDQVVSIQVMCEVKGEPQIFVQTSREIIRASLLQRSQLEKVKNARLGTLVVTPTGSACFHVYYKDNNWNIDVLSTNPFSLQVIQQIKTVTPLKSYLEQNTQFNTYYDQSTGKQYLVAVCYDRSFNISYVQLEITSYKIYETVFQAVPLELEKNQLHLAIESKSIKKLIPQQFQLYTRNLWEQLSNLQCQKFNTIIQQIFQSSSLALLPLQVGRETIAAELLQKGDAVWYCTSEQVWIESEILAQDYVNKTYAVKIPQGEEITYGECLRRRYWKYNYAKRANAEVISAFAAYSELLSYALDDPNIQNDLVLDKAASVFSEVLTKYNKGYMPYDCLSYLYEPFRKVTFWKDSKRLQQMMEMLDCFPSVLNLEDIQPPFQPAIEHVEMILETVVRYFNQQKKLITSQDLHFQPCRDNINRINKESDIAFQKIHSFFESHNFLTYFEKIVVHNKVLKLLNDEFKKIREEQDALQHKQIEEGKEKYKPEDVEMATTMGREYCMKQKAIDSQTSLIREKNSSKKIWDIQHKDKQELQQHKQTQDFKEEQDLLQQRQSDIVQSKQDLLRKTEKQSNQFYEIQKQQREKSNLQYRQNNQPEPQNDIHSDEQKDQSMIQQQEKELKILSIPNSDSLDLQNYQQQQEKSNLQARQNNQPEPQNDLHNDEQQDQSMIQQQEKELKTSSIPNSESQDLQQQFEQYVNVKGKQYFCWDGKKYPCIGKSGYREAREVQYQFQQENGKGYWCRADENKWFEIYLFPKWENLL